MFDRVNSTIKHSHNQTFYIMIRKTNDQPLKEVLEQWLKTYKHKSKVYLDISGGSFIFSLQDTIKLILQEFN